ncbi:MAG: DUF177 domain-containing protein [Solobacterium sp.]|nr:DUF177 domain-containing protein [Solobacterium sp.]
MIWTRSELIKTPHVHIDEDVTIDPEVFAGNTRINSVKDVHIEGSGYLEGTDRFYADIKIRGIMLCPDAITNREIEVPLETDTQEYYSFEESDSNDDSIRVVTEDVIDLLPAVIDAIWLEVPLQATEAEAEDYPSGEGWRVISEEEYEKSRKDTIDPRLAKLREFKED